MRPWLSAAGGGLLGGLLARGAAALSGRAGAPSADSFEVCSSFGCNTYTLTLVSAVDNGDGTVTVTWRRDGDDGDANAVPTMTTEVLIAGTVVSTSSTEWFPADHVETTATGAGAAGDAIEVRTTTTNFGGASATVTGTAE